MLSDYQINKNLKDAIVPAAWAVAEYITKSNDDYGDYSRLSFNEVVSRATATLQVAVDCLIKNDPSALIAGVQQTTKTRLKANYDPNAILRTMDLVARELVKAATAKHLEDTNFVGLITRRVNAQNQAAKLYVVRANLEIPKYERTDIDPDLLK